MSTVRTFFRHCPACGRRFEIRLVSRQLQTADREHKEVKEISYIPNQMVAGALGNIPPIVVEQSVPVTIESDEFQYSYKCKHCGHQWTEQHLEQREER
jgi:DNA-directed RNA polymerase subunit RPC12/RpoP